MYTEELVSVIDNVPPVSPHFYADDTQLLMPTNPDGVTVVCRALEQCVSDVSQDRYIYNCILLLDYLGILTISALLS